MIGLAVLRVRQAEAEAEVVERLPTPGGMSSPSVFGSPPPVGSGTGLAMPADERFQQAKAAACARRHQHHFHSARPIRFR